MDGIESFPEVIRSVNSPLGLAALAVLVLGVVMLALFGKKDSPATKITAVILLLVGLTGLVVVVSEGPRDDGPVTQLVTDTAAASGNPVDVPNGPDSAASGPPIAANAAIQNCLADYSVALAELDGGPSSSGEGNGILGTSSSSSISSSSTSGRAAQLGAAQKVIAGAAAGGGAQLQMFQDELIAAGVQAPMNEVIRVIQALNEGGDLCAPRPMTRDELRERVLRDLR